MKVLLVAVLAAVASLSFCSDTCRSEEKKAVKPKELTSNQVLMRDKLKQMNEVLEGITLDYFDQVEEAAKTLRMISKATSWHVSDPTPRYNVLSRNFQEVATDLERHAKERNADAATLDLVRMNVTCAQCHQHMRERTRQGK